MKNQHNHEHPEVPSTMVKKEDGTIELMFTIPYALVLHTQEEVIGELAPNVEVPGFRKGKAPKEKVVEKIPQDTLIQHTLSHILPHALTDAVEKFKIKLAIYPKFELVKADPNVDWEIKAVTCELPEVDLGNYKETIKGALKASQIWTPEKGKTEDKEKKEMTKEEKEQVVIKTLLDTVKVKIPQILMDEEVNARLSSLLERVEKLGLNLDSYLNSIGKTAQGLREDYKKQAEETLKFDLALAKIIDQDKITVAESEIASAIEASKADPSAAKIASEDQKRIVKRILEKRAALDGLTALL